MLTIRCDKTKSRREWHVSIKQLILRMVEIIRRILYMQLPEFDGLPEREEWLKKLEQRHIKFMDPTNSIHMH